ncbi:hypothetical protein BC826DRAFT_996000 [Russula brevipes]|nr:hypothetical protein BC826DRAFT_996000 [Russula brevipes]
MSRATLCLASVLVLLALYLTHSHLYLVASFPVLGCYSACSELYFQSICINRNLFPKDPSEHIVSRIVLAPIKWWWVVVQEM